MIILYLECGHRLMVQDHEGKKTKVGHLAYCLVCQDLKKITGKT